MASHHTNTSNRLHTTPTPVTGVPIRLHPGIARQNPWVDGRIRGAGVQIRLHLLGTNQRLFNPWVDGRIHGASSRHQPTTSRTRVRVMVNDHRTTTRRSTFQESAFQPHDCNSVASDHIGKASEHTRNIGHGIHLQCVVFMGDTGKRGHPMVGSHVWSCFKPSNINHGLCRYTDDVARMVGLQLLSNI
jgi:hypothetical protein